MTSESVPPWLKGVKGGTIRPFARLIGHGILPAFSSPGGEGMKTHFSRVKSASKPAPLGLLLGRDAAMIDGVCWGKNPDRSLGPDAERGEFLQQTRLVQERGRHG